MSKKDSSSARNWSTIKSKTIVDNYFCKLVEEKVLTSTGKIIPKYFLVSRRDVVIIVPVTKFGKFVLIREYKHGIKKKILLFPAGLAEKGEKPKKTAIRELEEETGYCTKKLKYLGSYYEFPSNDTHRVYIFLAKGLPEVPNNSSIMSEETKLYFITKDKLKSMILKNKFKLATAVCAFILAEKALSNKA